MAKLTVVVPDTSELALLVDDFLQAKRAIPVSRKTIAIYKDALEGVLIPFAAKRDVTTAQALSDRLINDLRVGLLDGTGSRSGRPLSPDTVDSYVRAMNSFLAYERAKGATVPPNAKLGNLKRRDLAVLSREELRNMEDAATTERDKLIVRILADTGLRLNELLGLTLADLRMDGRSCGLLVHGKGGDDRTVPVKPEVWRRLQRYAAKTRRDADTDRIFTANRRSRWTGQYEALTDSGVQQMIREVAVAAGISRRVYPHLLRHSFATHFLRKGGSPLLLQKILGHESLAMITRTYSHLNYGDAHAEAMRILDVD